MTLLISLAVLFDTQLLFSQTSVSIDLASSPNIDFTFNTIAKLNNGIVIPNAITLNVDAVGGQWDLYAGTITGNPGTWDVAQFYTNTGNGAPPIGLLQMRVHNLSNTPQISGYVPLQDVATSTLDIIGTHLFAPDPTVHCSDVVHVGTNTPGTYTVDPQCYQFRVDLKIAPGIIYRPGVYTLQIEFIIQEDL